MRYLCDVVQKPYHVRITDFGLAKLLDTNEREFRSQGGRVSAHYGWDGIGLMTFNACVAYESFNMCT